MVRGRASAMSRVEPGGSSEGNCPFLRQRAAGKIYCEAAINFGLDFASYKDLCSSCEVPTLIEAPRCRHLEVYAYLYLATGQRAGRRVGATLMCGLDGIVVDAEECHACSRQVRFEAST